MDSYITPAQYRPGTVSVIPTLKRAKGNPKTRHKTNYLDCICTFDIETTRLRDIEQSIMYVWMLHIHHHVTIVGRTWEEYAALMQQITAELGDRTMVIYVHNLSYEFQFLRAVIDWQTEDVFAVDRRKVLKATAYDKHVEFRCSYLHSNMSLAEYTRKFNVEHGKLSGAEFDYTAVRYPWTELTDAQIAYCLNDVIGLAECLETEMAADGDTLYTIPLTSTGYVRRDAKRAMRTMEHSYVRNQLPNEQLYSILREAFRGGNTHANRYYANRIVRNVNSADRSSSYPDVLCNCLFPVTPFFHVGTASFNQLMTLINKRHKAIVMRVSFTNIRLTNEFWGCPYLIRDKCRRIVAGIYDNGRILSAEYLETTLTDVDLRIVLSEYSFDDMCAFDVAYATYGKLPAALVQECINYYKAKTELKDVPGQEIYYMKSKNKLNSIYGMMAQDPVKQSTIYRAGEWSVAEDPLQELLDTHNRKAFLAYQWGCWVTAWARYRLEEGIRLAGDGFVYCDTDSVKYVGSIDWETYNKARITDSLKSNAYATDPAGHTHYMGVYEEERGYYEFKTLGAKKYAYTYEPNGSTHVTIAGVTKKSGGKELDKHGGLRAFETGFTFVEAGGTESLYNDNPEIGTINREGHQIRIYPNIVIRESTYTLGITAEYREILENSCLPLDRWQYI